MHSSPSGRTFRPATKLIRDAIGVGLEAPSLVVGLAGICVLLAGFKLSAWVRS
jgi:hypothetical protein